MQHTDSQPVERDNGFEDIEALFDEVRLLAKRLGTGGKSEDSEGAFAGSALSVFRALSEHGPQTVPQIARLRGTSRQNIQILVNRLAGEGLLEFAGNPAHKRSELVNLTVAGRTVFATAERQETEFVAGLVSRLPEADVAAASAVLRRIRELIAEEEKRGENAERRGQKSGIRSQKPQGRQPKTPEESAAEKVAVPEVDENELPYNLL